MIVQGLERVLSVALWRKKQIVKIVANDSLQQNDANFAAFFQVFETIYVNVIQHLGALGIFIIIN